MPVMASAPAGSDSCDIDSWTDIEHVWFIHQVRCFMHGILRQERLLSCLKQCETGFFNRFRTIISSSTNEKDYLRIFNSLSQSIESAHDDQNEKGIACYTCGPTVYDSAHLGHARTYVWLDIFRRVLQATCSKPPLFVLNITDVDDKILQRAKETNKNPTEVARGYEEEFWRDWDALNCLRPHVVTRVTEHVESDIIRYIQQIESNGCTYETDEGLWFDVKAFEDQARVFHSKYGKLAPPSQATDFFVHSKPGTNLDAKRDARDFALWKRRKDDEELFWSSPWGEGRPGWHIECSAMIQAVADKFGDSHDFKIHAGGIDLKFPHHTNEIAQAEAFLLKSPKSGGEWIQQWLHTGHLHIDGLKMSKSLKNFITIDEMLQEDQNDSSLSSPSDDFRLWCLGQSGSYRQAATYSKTSLQQASRMRQKILRFLLEGEAWVKQDDKGAVIRRVSHSGMELLKEVSQAHVTSLHALYNDLDGKVFLDTLISLSESGIRYMQDSGPPEPLIAALDFVRMSLSMVGFSSRSVNAGLEIESGTETDDKKAVIDELVKFRSVVRTHAQHESNTDELWESVLEECDRLRDITLPSIGVDLRDGGSASSWSETIPSSLTYPSSPDPPIPQSQNILDTPVEKFFQTRQYEGQFAAFDEGGFPTRMKDGAPLSARLRKKLLKRLEKHRKRLGISSA